jgi:hypothetical protein
MQLVGHKTESIYRRYAIVPKRDLLDGVSRLAEYRSRLEPEKDDPKSVGGSEMVK